MTPDDALEGELESLRPRPASPELRRWIGARLARRRRRPVWIGLAAAAAVAGVAVGLSIHRPPHEFVEPPRGQPPAVVAVVPPPSVLVYERAFAESSAALDALLDEEAVRTGRDVTPARAGIFPDLLALKGTTQ